MGSEEKRDTYRQRIVDADLVATALALDGRLRRIEQRLFELESYCRKLDARTAGSIVPGAPPPSTDA